MHQCEHTATISAQFIAMNRCTDVPVTSYPLCLCPTMITYGRHNKKCFFFKITIINTYFYQNNAPAYTAQKIEVVHK
jgi:hypothetical protein